MAMQGWILPVASPLIAVSLCLPACTRKSLKELAREQIPGMWRDAAGRTKLECLPDGTARVQFKTEIGAPVDVKVQGSTTAVRATLIGIMEIESRYRLDGTARAEFFIPGDSNQAPLSLALATAALSESGLRLYGSHSAASPVTCTKQAPGGSTNTNAVSCERADLESDGWYYAAEPASGIMVGENLFMAMGGISGGVLDIAQGFTIQDLPRFGFMLLAARKPASVAALIVTKGGLRLVTSYSSKKVVYGLEAAQVAGQAGAAPAWAASRHVRLIPRFVSFAAQGTSAE
jgi:hypothetical protein